MKIFYNPETGEAYSEFVGVPGDPMGFVGWFLMCCGGFNVHCCGVALGDGTYRYVLWCVMLQCGA